MVRICWSYVYLNRTKFLSATSIYSSFKSRREVGCWLKAVLMEILQGRNLTLDRTLENINGSSCYPAINIYFNSCSLVTLFPSSISVFDYRNTFLFTISGPHGIRIRRIYKNNQIISPLRQEGFRHRPIELHGNGQQPQRIIRSYF